MRADRSKPATEQPGNSFKYLYWRLSKEDFQQLCAALLKAKFKAVQCYPVGMADTGIDAIANGSIAFQVKWTSKFEQNPVAWLKAAIEGERGSIKRMVRERGISKYILMTSVAGTTTAERTGTVQKLDVLLAEFSREFGIPVECWWQADIDAEVDSADPEIKWAYAEMLAGVDAIRYLILGDQGQSRASAMRETLLKVIARQRHEDAKVKFSQVDLDQKHLVDLFIDVPQALTAPPTGRVDEFIARQNREAFDGEGTAECLTKTSFPLTYLLGEPGQGKSTISQYLCQIHRASILPITAMEPGLPPERLTNPKLPLRVDLRDYGSWLSGRDPFGDEPDARKPRARAGSGRSLELFLAHFCRHHSGGREVDVEHIQDMIERYPTLLVLDGLDEIASADTRRIAVAEIEKTIQRLAASPVSKRHFQVIVTARPNAGGLTEPDKSRFQTLTLQPLSLKLQQAYVSKWADVHGVRGQQAKRLKRISGERVRYDHVAQLATNAMQLTILLFLINRQGESVPVSRTPLYSEYMKTLLDREINNQQIAKEQVPHIIETTAFLGWHMQAGVEADHGLSRMKRKDIEDTLNLYYRRTGGPADLVEALFGAVTDRFWVMTSKIEGTFEFAVQPVREYFAARFLYDLAGQDRKDQIPKGDVLRELVERPYWLNTARFYAGFANRNTLAGLRYGLKEAVDGGNRPLQTRSAIWTLLGDGVFHDARLALQKDVVSLLTDDLSIRLIGAEGAERTFPQLAWTAGGEILTEILLDQIDLSPADVLNLERARIIRERICGSGVAAESWWLSRFDKALGSRNESTWLRVGELLGVTKITNDRAASLASPSGQQPALL